MSRRSTNALHGAHRVSPSSSCGLLGSTSSEEDLRHGFGSTTVRSSSRPAPIPAFNRTPLYTPLYTPLRTRQTWVSFSGLATARMARMCPASTSIVKTAMARLPDRVTSAN